jgi:putative membrane protein
MFWWWGPGGGWVAGLITAAIWIGLVVAAVLLLRGELPNLQHRFGDPPALRMLEERYARGEIDRQEFLERRRVLLERPPSPPPGPASPMPDQPPPPGHSDPTQPLPPSA